MASFEAILDEAVQLIVYKPHTRFTRQTNRTAGTESRQFCSPYPTNKHLLSQLKSNPPCVTVRERKLVAKSQCLLSKFACQESCLMRPLYIPASFLNFGEIRDVFCVPDEYEGDKCHIEHLNQSRRCCRFTRPSFSFNRCSPSCMYVNMGIKHDKRGPDNAKIAHLLSEEADVKKIQAFLRTRREPNWIVAGAGMLLLCFKDEAFVCDLPTLMQDTHFFLHWFHREKVLEACLECAVEFFE